MPRRDGTGPVGQGANTGKGKGGCSNTNVGESFSNRGNRRGGACVKGAANNFGKGRGRCCKRNFETFDNPLETK